MCYDLADTVIRAVGKTMLELEGCWEERVVTAQSVGRQLRGGHKSVAVFLFHSF